jgi:hypothetical protein
MLGSIAVGRSQFSLIQNTSHHSLRFEAKNSTERSKSGVYIFFLIIFLSPGKDTEVLNSINRQKSIKSLCPNLDFSIDDYIDESFRCGSKEIQTRFNRLEID